MPRYSVTWEIDVDADDPVAAAREAFGHMQRPGTTATTFDLVEQGEEEAAGVFRIDLAEHGAT